MSDLKFICQNCNTKLIQVVREIDTFKAIFQWLGIIPSGLVKLRCPKCNAVVIEDSTWQEGSAELIVDEKRE